MSLGQPDVFPLRIHVAHFDYNHNLRRLARDSRDSKRRDVALNRLCNPGVIEGHFFIVASSHALAPDSARTGALLAVSFGIAGQVAAMPDAFQHETRRKFYCPGLLQLRLEFHPTCVRQCHGKSLRIRQINRHAFRAVPVHRLDLRARGQVELQKNLVGTLARRKPHMAALIGVEAFEQFGV